MEDFQRQRAAITRGSNSPHEVHDGQVTLAGHVSEAPAPVQQVHVDERSVSELDDEDLVARYRAARVRFDLAREPMKAAEDQCWCDPPFKRSPKRRGGR